MKKGIGVYSSLPQMSLSEKVTIYLQKTLELILSCILAIELALSSVNQDLDNT